MAINISKYMNVNGRVCIKVYWTKFVGFVQTFLPYKRADVVCTFLWWLKCRTFINTSRLRTHHLETSQLVSVMVGRLQTLECSSFVFKLPKGSE